LLTDRAANGAYLQTYLRERGVAVELLPVNEVDDWEAHLLALQPGAIVLDLREATWERGWQLIDRLKLREETRDIPILLSSLLVEQKQGAVLALDLLAKPLASATLSQALWNLGLPEGAAIKNETILIADDDPAILALHRDIVAAHFPDCRISTALNGRQALEFLQRGERPLLILLDLMMPELDGIGLIEAMQSDERLRTIPVIVLTAQHLSEEDIDRLGRGVASILQKGMFTFEETLVQIERVLASSKQQRGETQRLVHKAMAFIQTNYAQSISRTQIADYVGISPRHLTRCFSQAIGLSPIEYLNRFRVNQARRLLDEGNLSITDVMNAVGFGDSSYFSRVFRREMGVSPTGYLRRADKSDRSPPDS
jgi:AraC-like DNA-binding protein